MLYSRLKLFVVRFLEVNKLTALPEGVFSRNTRLTRLLVLSFFFYLLDKMNILVGDEDFRIEASSLDEVEGAALADY